ncbi:hypothetical protein [Marinilabilia sp.]|uniref:hypothetical protein n=1 Tax=Marinilabilia sp. TaxID=2021252 RepID=UPI0025B8AB91|nr:hypothetical protein [Marinilabilia sp.]
MNLIELLPIDRPFKNLILKAPLIVYDKLKFSNAKEFSVPVINRKLLIQVDTEADFTIRVINKEADLRDEWEASYLSSEELFEILKNQSLVHYSLRGQMKSSGTLTLSDIMGFEIGASGSVELSQITTHANSTTIGNALKTDLTDYKNLLTQSGDSSFWDTLKPNDALIYSLIGNLDFEVSINILKLISMAFSPVFALTSSGSKVPLKINPSAGIRFKAVKNDSFKILIAKKNDTSFTLLLQKNQQREKNFEVSGTLSVMLIDADVIKVNELIDDYFEKYLGKPLTEIETILQKAEEIEQDHYLIRLAENIAFNGTDLAQLKERFEAWKLEIAAAREKVFNIISKSITAGIAYEYRKIQSTGTLFEARLSKEVLTSELKNVLTLSISNLISAARNHLPGIEVKNYLLEKNLSIEEQFSFGISLGNMALKSASKQIYQYDEKNIGLKADRLIKLSFLDEKVVTVFGEEVTIEASLDAETPTPKNPLTYNELEYNFTLTSKKSDRRIRPWDKKDLHRFLQTALVWNIFGEEELSEFFASTWNNLLKNRDVEYECKLHIPHGIFPQTIHALSHNASVEAISNVMAASILPNNFDKRSLLMSARREFYTPLIMSAFQGKDIMNHLDQPLYTDKYKRWRHYEITQIQNQNTSGTDSFMSIANNRTFKHFQELISAINLLNDRLRNKKILEPDLEESVLKFFFKAFHSVVKDSSGFAQRWLGYFILESITKESPLMLGSVVNTLTIIYPDDNNKKEALLIGG